MTRDLYLDMCDQLSAEPITSEIPIELQDLPEEAQEAWSIYCHLTDRIDGFSGHYFGKAYDNITSIFELFQVEDKLTCFKIVLMFDETERNQINSKKKK